MRKLLFGLIGIVVLAVAAIVIVPGLIDLRPFVQPVLQSAKEQTGREVRIGGIGLSILPMPTATVSDLRVANIQGAANPDMVRVKSVDVRVALLPLLSGRVEVQSITVVDPVIAIETLRDGRSSLDFPKREQAAGGGAMDVQLQQIAVTNGLVVLRDAAGAEKRIEKANVTASAQSLTGPFRAKGTATAMGVPVNLDVNTGRVEPGKPAAIAAALEGAGARMQFQGNVTGAQSPTQPSAVAGKFSLSANNLAEFAERVNAGGAALPPLAAQSFVLEGNVKGTTAQFQVPDISVGLGEMRGTGALAVGVADKTTVQFALNLGRIDLDKIIAGSAPPARTPAAQTPAAIPAPAKPGAPTAGAAPPPVISPNLVAAIDIKVDAIAYRGQAMQQARVQVDVVNGVALLKQLSAQLPAGSSVRVANLPLPLGGKPPAIPDGRIEARSDDLRGLLEWLGSDLSYMPQGRLRRFEMKAGVRSDGQSVQIANLEAALDSSRLTGGLTMVFRDRPGFGVRANLDRINLDAYMPVAAKPAKAAPRAQAKPQPVGGPLDAFKALETFDLNLLAEIGTLTYRENDIKGVKVELQLVGGKLTVKEARIQDLASAQVDFKLEAEKLSTQPAFSTDFNLRAPDARRFLKFVTRQEAALPQQLAGQLTAAGKASGTLDQMRIDTSMQGFGGQGKIAGTLAQLTQQAPKLDLGIDASFPEFGPILAMVAAGTKPDQKLGPFSMKGRLANTGPDTIKLSQGQVRAFGGELDVDGTVSKLLDPEPAVDASANLKLPSLKPLLAAFNPDPQLMATADQLGALAFAGKAAGTTKKATLRDAALNGLGGSMRLNGDILDVFDARRQYDLTADVRSFNVGPLLAAMPGKLMTAQGAKQLGPVNGKLAIKGRMDNLNLRMDNLAMQGFGGTMAMNGSVTDAMDPTRRLDLTFDVNNVNMGQLLGAFPASGASPALAQQLQTAVIKGAIKGPGASPTVNLQQAQVQGFGGQASATGSVADAAGANAKYDLTASANFPNLYQVLTAFYRPAMQINGPLQFEKVHLVGDAKKVQIQNLNGRVGPMGLTGQGFFVLDGKRPKLDMEIKTTGDLLIDAFMPADAQKRTDLLPYWKLLFPDLLPATEERGIQLAQTQQQTPQDLLKQLFPPKQQQQAPAQPAPQQKPAAPQQPAQQQPQQPQYEPVKISTPPQNPPPDPRWSRQPFNYDALKNYDLNLRLGGVQSIRYQKYALQNLTGQVAIDNGVLNIRQLAGQAYGGQLTGNIALNANNVPQGTVDFNLVRANAYELMKAVANNDRLEGWLSTNGKFQFQGRNEAEVVSTLTGGASVAGEVKARISQQERMQVGMVQQLGSLMGGQTDNLAQTMTTLTGGYTSGLIGMLSFVGLLMVDDPGKISGNIDFRNGLMTERDLQIVNKQVLIVTTGWVSLPAYRQDFAIEAHRRQAAAQAAQTKQPQQPYIAAQLRGPLDDKRNVRVYGERVQRGVAAGPGGVQGSTLQDALKGGKPQDVLKSVLGGGAQQPAPTTTTTAPATTTTQPSKTQQQIDQFKGLLEQFSKPKQ